MKIDWWEANTSRAVEIYLTFYNQKIRLNRQLINVTDEQKGSINNLRGKSPWLTTHDKRIANGIP